MNKPLPDRDKTLSPVEVTVMRYLTEGYTVAEIADLQCVRAATVHSRAARARRKLGASTLDHAVQLYAAQQAAQAAARSC